MRNAQPNGLPPQQRSANWHRPAAPACREKGPGECHPRPGPLTDLFEQMAEARAQGGQAQAYIDRLSATLPFLTERVERRRILTDKGWGSRIAQLELDEQRMDHSHQIDVQRQVWARATASEAGVRQQLLMARAEAQREVLTDLAKAEADARLREEEVIKADAKGRLQVLKSPVDGIVQQLAVYTEGAVLKPADPILVVVPKAARLVVEAQILNRDIGFVKTGQRVTIKLDAFPFTRYGTLDGRVTEISRDAIADEKLGAIYVARIVAEPPSTARDIVLAPGLAGTAEVRTGERRVIDFLLSPLERRLNEAGREQ